ncbi:MAG: FAD-dependent oxidoreductase [Promethearchaeota archaeon]
MTESKQEDKIASNEVFEKAIASSNYCYNCNRCVNVCPQAIDGRFSPRNVISDLTLLSVEEAVKNTNTWHCLTCALCMEYCPMSLENVGVDILEIILNLRTLTRDIEVLKEQQMSCQHGRSFSSIPELMATDKLEVVNKLGFLEGSKVKIAEKGNVGYFMGCLPYMGGIAPCSQACPAGLDVQGYVALIKEGKFQEALDLIRERNPFPIVCGRVCTHPCELSCNRKNIDEPVAIRALKRFVADWEIENKGKSSIKPVNQTEDKVAIVGSGPAGLTAAYYLARKGYKPTVFEENSYKGGRLRSGIPEYRLPQDTLDYEIAFIENMGVEIKTNTLIGPSLTFDDLKEQGYKAFFISVGLGNSRPLGVKGDDINNVFYGLKFLEDENIGVKKHKFKDKVVGVVGGGNVAIDSARTALRLGAMKVIVIYRRSKKEMPALEEEIEAAKHEGIEFQFLTNPYQIISDKKGSCSEVECIRMELGEPDSSGRRRPIEIKGSQFKMKIDVLIAAIGQVPELSLIKAAEPQLEINKWGYVDHDEITMETNVPGVFIGGDILGGNGVAITAIANGYEVAESIDRFISGKDLKQGRIRRAKYKFSPIPKKEVQVKKRQAMNELNPTERVNHFGEIELGFTQDQAIMEANRCLNCSSCSSCDQFEGITAQKCNYGSYPSLLYSKSVDYLKIPISTIGLLNQKEIVPVVLPEEKCCGHDLYWKGDIAAFKKLARYNVKIYKDAGVKTMVFSCAEGYKTWKDEYRKLFKEDEFDFEIYHITEYVLKEGLLENVSFPVHDKIKITYHDPCRLGRMSGVYDAPRDIFEHIPFVEIVEMKNNRNLASCCGVSAYLSCNDNSKALQGKRIQEAIDTGAHYLIVSCPKCLAHLNCYLDEHPELRPKIKISDLSSFLGHLLMLN